jgi:UDP-N-acetylmuramyl tripeptide synthase
MTRQIWRMLGQRSASIGTLGVTTSDDQVKTGLTTPDMHREPDMSEVLPYVHEE